MLSTWHRYGNVLKQYLIAKEKYLMELNPDDIGNDIHYVWDGSRVNSNALLTVFRHFDSASVVNGFIGNLGHQLETRLYIDFLRMEGRTIS